MPMPAVHQRYRPRENVQPSCYPLLLLAKPNISITALWEELAFCFPGMVQQKVTYKIPSSASPPPDDDGASALRLPAGCTAVSWRVEAGASVRAGDVLGYCTSGGSGGNSSNTGASGAGGGAGGGLIRPKKRARPRPKAADKGGTTTAASGGPLAVPKRKVGGGVSLGSLVAGIGRTDSTLTGGSGSSTTGTGATNGSAVGEGDGDAEGEGSSTTGGSSGKTNGHHGPSTNGVGSADIPLKAPSDGFLRIVKSSHRDGIIGYVEPCHHPAVIDGLCAVCGSMVDQTKGRPTAGGGASGGIATIGTAGSSSMTSSSLHAHSPAKGSGSGGSSSSSHFTVSGGLTISISQSEAKSIASDSSARLRSAKKLSLVLDLDHTLLHATADPRAEAYVARSCLLLDDENRRRRREDVRTLVLPAMEGGVQISEPIPPPLRHYVKLRPHLAKFLTEANERYEFTIYTAGTRSYAHKVAHVISRHIVGARLDEEELNNLRRSLAAEEEKAKWHQARMKRRRYVEGLNQKLKATATEKEEETQIREDVSIIFDDTEEKGEEEDMAKEDIKEATDSEAVEEKKGDDEDERGNNPGETNLTNTAADKDDTTSKAITFDDKKAEGKSNSKRSGDAGSDPIPRKRKRVSFDPTAKEEKNESKDTAKDEAAEAKRIEEETFDQTELEASVKRLRADLGEAERLEKKANELRMKLFGSRIVSRTDVSDLGRDVKSLRRVFPCGGTMAAIIDDREDVWANADNNATGRPGEPPDNLLLIRPYHWKPFSGFADVNNEAGVDVTKAGGEKDNRAESVEDEEQQERQLLWMGDILRRVHERYYAATVSEEKRDSLSVPGILCDLRRNVLGSPPFCRVVLSGLVPLHKQNQLATGATVRPSIVRYVESLGARVMADVNAGTTHVIAARDGTEKTLKARKFPGCAVVRISWLMECWWSITRRELKPNHLIGPLPKAISSRSKTKSSTVIDAAASEEDGTGNRLLLSGSDSSEDEDFAAELEADFMQ